MKYVFTLEMQVFDEEGNPLIFANPRQAGDNLKSAVQKGVEVLSENTFCADVRIIDAKVQAVDWEQRKRATQKRSENATAKKRNGWRE